MDTKTAQISKRIRKPVTTDETRAERSQPVTAWSKLKMQRDWSRAQRSRFFMRYTRDYVMADTTITPYIINISDARYKIIRELSRHLGSVFHDARRFTRPIVVLWSALRPRPKDFDGGVALHAVLLCQVGVHGSVDGS